MVTKKKDKKKSYSLFLSISIMDTVDMLSRQDGRSISAQVDFMLKNSLKQNNVSILKIPKVQHSKNLGRIPIYKKNK